MRTLDEVTKAFTPVGKLDAGSQQRLLHLENLFKNTAQEIFDLVPECADRTAALRKLLEAKFTCAQAVSHYNSPVQVPAQGTALAPPSEEVKKNVTNKKAR